MKTAKSRTKPIISHFYINTLEITLMHYVFGASDVLKCTFGVFELVLDLFESVSCNLWKMVHAFFEAPIGNPHFHK